MHFWVPSFAEAEDSLSSYIVRDGGDVDGTFEDLVGCGRCAAESNHIRDSLAGEWGVFCLSEMDFVSLQDVLFDFRRFDD